MCVCMCFVYLCFCQKNDKGFDPFLRMVKPKPGAAWDFSITEDQDAELLGLHQWDDRCCPPLNDTLELLLFTDSVCGSSAIFRR